jgi:hypothetical protein
VSCVRRTGYFAVCLAVASIACGAQEPPAVSPIRPIGVSNNTVVCNAVMDRFVGIPALEDETTAAQAKALSGRWWIRGCSTKVVASGIRVQLEGPGWYFVDQRDSDFELRQQVSFTLGVALEGRVDLSVRKGVAALRFEPKTEPDVELHIARNLSVHATSAWGSLITWFPLVSVSDRAAERLSALAASALRSELREGATATYDLASGERDAALGKLPAGQTPQPAFPDGIPWLVNDRLFLPPNATQVVGPIDPGSTRLDVRIEQGSGLAYRTVCQCDMPGDYDAIATGHLDRLPPPTSAASGALRGVGEHSAMFRVDDCRFFVVVSTLGDSTTVAALRVRA